MEDEKAVFAAPVQDYGVIGEPGAQQPIIAITTAFGGAAGIFNPVQMSDLLAQILTWAGSAPQMSPRRSSEPEWVEARPVHVPNLAVAPADEPDKVSLIVPVGPLRLQFIVPREVIASLPDGMARMDSWGRPKPPSLVRLPRRVHPQR